MTTIACDLNGMAADSKCVFGDINFPIGKIFRLPDGTLLATAGTAAYTAPFEQAMKEGKVPELKPDADSDFCAIHLTKDGVFAYDCSYHPDRVLSGKCAIGTGAQVAMSWLLNGATPQQAVERACEVDNNSGLPVQYEPLKPNARRQNTR